MTPSPSRRVVQAAADPDQHDLLDKHQLARRLGISPKTVAERVRSGQFPHVRIGRREPGARELRLIRFTPENVAQIEAEYVEHVPGRSA